MTTTSHGRVKLAPSILSADFARLGDQVREAVSAGADRIHVDVMDGHFVPNITIGPLVVRAVRRVTAVPIEVHLMIEHPDQFVEAFADAGADCLEVHVEGARHLHRTVHRVKALDKRVGVVLNPATPAEAISEILPDLDVVLAMTVNPGFGGQRFIASVVPKLTRLREMIDRTNPTCELEVDGGIDPTTAPSVVQAGARVLVAGSAIFGAPEGVTQAARRLLEASAAALSSAR